MVIEGDSGPLDGKENCPKSGRRMVKVRPKEVIFDEDGFDGLVDVYNDIYEYIKFKNTLEIIDSNWNRFFAGLMNNGTKPAEVFGVSLCMHIPFNE